MWEVLSGGGYVYICGDAAQMEPAVEAALAALITANGEDGEKFLSKMRDDGRFQKDTWF